MNFNLVPNVNMSTTLQAMADQLKIHTKLQSFFNVGGIDGQPMVRIGTLGKGAFRSQFGSFFLPNQRAFRA